MCFLCAMLALAAHLPVSIPGQRPTKGKPCSGTCPASLAPSDCLCPGSLPDCLCPAAGPSVTRAANDTWQPTWIFVSGFHHSGTTLVSRALANASEGSGAIVTHSEQNEGGHRQSLWPTASDVLLNGSCANWTPALCIPAFVI